ncbi:MAG: PilZ domain-containing protein [Oligoflexus sp.]
MGNRRIFEKRALQTRLQRFPTDGFMLKSIIRHSCSRCSSFWLGIRNISQSGLAAEHLGPAFIPFASGDAVELTLDTACKVFSRPIHLSCIVVRRTDLAQRASMDFHHTIFGLEIISIDERHDYAWQLGLNRLGNPPRTEP